MRKTFQLRDNLKMADPVKRKSLLAALLVIVVALAVYGNTLTNSFVYDDYKVVVQNTFIRQWANAASLFNSHYFRLSREMSYRPVVTLSYFLDYFLWKLNPGGYHLTNLLLHALNGVLLYFLVGELFRKPGVSLACALLFTVHPITTEAVNAVSFREDLLTLTFCLLAFIAYLKAPSAGPRRGRYILLCLISFFFALFSKEMAATFPFLLLLYELCFNRKFLRTVKKRLPVYCGLFLILGFYLLVRFSLLRNPRELMPDAPYFYPRILTMSRAVFLYLKLLFFPVKLCVEYLYRYSFSLSEPKVFFSVIGLLAVLGAGVFAFLRSSRFSFGIWWFFLTLIPVANVFPLENPVAERYLYLPAVGFCLVLAVAGESVFVRLRSPAKYLPPAFLVLLLCLYSCRTASRNRDWKDSLSLAWKALESSPHSARFHNNLGIAYEKKGLFEEAISEYQAALRINPNYMNALYNLGFAYEKLDRLDEALEKYQAVLKIDPGSARVHNRAGVVHIKKGDFESAVEEFQATLKIDPRLHLAHNNLALVYEARGRLDEAANEYRTALKINPDSALAHNNLGMIYESQGRLEEAVNEYRAALKINPGFAEARNNLGIAYKTRGWLNRAIREFRAVLKIDPDNPDVHNNLGNAYLEKGSLEKAVREYRTVLRLNPDSAQAHNNLGNIFAGRGEYAEARAHWEKALALDPALPTTEAKLERLRKIGF